MVATQLDFERFVLDHPGHAWELHRGQVREKPTMSAEHGHLLDECASMLYAQIDRRLYRIRMNTGRVARSDEQRYIPDLFVVEADRVTAARRRGESLETYREPVLLVIEVWSPSTGNYDVDEKIPEYLSRGDAEVWRLHPLERSLKGWRRRPDGGYDEFVAATGIVEPVALPGVKIDLDALFAPPE